MQMDANSRLEQLADVLLGQIARRACDINDTNSHAQLLDQQLQTKRQLATLSTVCSTFHCSKAIGQLWPASLEFRDPGALSNPASKDERRKRMLGLIHYAVNPSRPRPTSVHLANPHATRIIGFVLLDVGNLPGGGGQAPVAISERIGSVTQLDVSDDTLLDGEALSLALASLPAVSSLALSRCRFAADVINVLEPSGVTELRLENLGLSLGPAGSMVDLAWGDVARLTQLTSLHVAFPSPPPGAILRWDVSPLASLVKLRRLSLRRWAPGPGSRLVLDGLDRVSQGCRQLDYLRISAGLHPDMIPVPGWPALREAYLESERWVTCMAGLGLHLAPLLETFDMSAPMDNNRSDPFSVPNRKPGLVLSPRLIELSPSIASLCCLAPSAAQKLASAELVLDDRFSPVHPFSALPPLHALTSITHVVLTVHAEQLQGVGPPESLAAAFPGATALTCRLQHCELGTLRAVCGCLVQAVTHPGLPRLRSLKFLFGAAAGKDGAVDATSDTASSSTATIGRALLGAAGEVFAFLTLLAAHRPGLACAVQGLPPAEQSHLATLQTLMRPHGECT